MVGDCWKNDYLHTKVVVFPTIWDPHKGPRKPSRLDFKQNKRVVISKLQNQVAKWKCRAMNAITVESRLTHYSIFDKEHVMLKFEMVEC
jgi:hypothetical protein